MSRGTTGFAGPQNGRGPRRTPRARGTGQRRMQRGSGLGLGTSAGQVRARGSGERRSGVPPRGRRTQGARARGGSCHREADT
eukprot:2317972-Pyramimonas_sp.AAC.1